MTSISKIVYINKLDGIDNKFKNAYQSTVKLNPTDVKSSTDIDFVKKNKKEGPEFNVGNHVRILKYENVFAKGYVPIWFEEVFVIKKIKNIVWWTFVISDLNGEEIFESFTKKNSKNKSKRN